MLFFHRFEDIKDLPVAVIVPPGTKTQTNLTALASDLWDYHLDHRRWWQQTHNKLPIPLVAPRFGRAYPRLHVKAVKMIFRQITEEHTLLVNPGSSDDVVIVSPSNNPSGWPLGTQGAYFPDVGSEGYALSSLTPIGGGPPDPTPPPASGSHKVYWRTNRGTGHFDVGTGSFVIDEVASYHYGVFTIEETKYNMGPSPGFIQSIVRDEFISDHKVARLNYLSFLDKKVLRSGVDPLPDPQPITEPSWKGPWNATTTYKVSDIVSDESKTYVSIQDGKNRKPKTSRLFWERCNRPRAQILSGATTISQFNAVFGFTGAQTYLFPDRTDIKPLCLRPFSNAETQRDWRTFGDSWGIQLAAPAGFGGLGFLVGTDGFNAGALMHWLFDLHPSGVDLWNGIDHVITGTATNTLDSDEGYVLFQDRVDTYSITQNMNVKLTEEPAP